MEKISFLNYKENLNKLIQDFLANDSLEENTKASLIKLSEILNQYSFENRLDKKGLLSHTIIDSLELNYSFGEKFIMFDNSIK